MHLSVPIKLQQAFIKRIVTGFLLGLAFLALFFYLPPWVLSGVLLAILIAIVLFEWPRICPLGRMWCVLMAPLYPILPFAIMIDLNHQAVYRSVLFFAFVVAPTFDTGSYLVGSAFGRYKLCTPISPDKTWEGFFGGVLFVGVTLAMAIGMRAGFWCTLRLTLATAVVALAGDLFESWLKRTAGLKDSGNVLPGHGGFLDRFDSIISVTLFYYLLRGYLAPLLP